VGIENGSGRGGSTVIAVISRNKSPQGSQIAVEEVAGRVALAAVLLIQVVNNPVARAGPLGGELDNAEVPSMHVGRQGCEIGCCGSSTLMEQVLQQGPKLQRRFYSKSECNGM
jgi:hypothetical protein